MGTVVVLALVAAAAALCVRYLLRQRKRGGCNGDCGHCKGCH